MLKERNISFTVVMFNRRQLGKPFHIQKIKKGIDRLLRCRCQNVYW